MAAVLALLSAVTYGAGDFLGGLAARRLPPAAVVLRGEPDRTPRAAAVAPFFDAAEVLGRDLAYGAGGGLVGGIGVLLLYRGLAVGTMSVVAPITAVLSAIVPVLVGPRSTASGPRASRWAASPLPSLAIALLSRDGSDHDERAPHHAGRARDGARSRSRLRPVLRQPRRGRRRRRPVAPRGREGRVGGDVRPRRRCSCVSARVGSDAARRGTTPSPPPRLRAVRLRGQRPVPAGHPRGAADARRRAGLALPGLDRRPGHDASPTNAWPEPRSRASRSPLVAVVAITAG